MRIAEFLGLVVIGLCTVALAYQISAQRDAMFTLTKGLNDTNATVASIIAERDAERSR
jgi:hypothetical protein